MGRSLLGFLVGLVGMEGSILCMAEGRGWVVVWIGEYAEGCRK